MESAALPGGEGRRRKWALGIIWEEQLEWMSEEAECRKVSEGSGYMKTSEEAEIVCKVANEKMNAIYHYLDLQILETK